VADSYGLLIDDLRFGIDDLGWLIWDWIAGLIIKN
jgi:hypothetical protein